MTILKINKPSAQGFKIRFALVLLFIIAPTAVSNPLSGPKIKPEKLPDSGVFCRTGPGAPLLQFSSDPRCWAKLSTEKGKMCFSLNQFQVYTSRSEPCFRWQGKIKPLKVNPFRRSLHEKNNVNSPQYSSKATPTQVFVLVSSKLAFDDSSQGGSPSIRLNLWQRLKLKVLKLSISISNAVNRARASFILQITPLDTTGAITSLITGAKTHLELNHFLRVLGFVHLLNQSGIHFHFLRALSSCALKAVWIESFLPLSVLIFMERLVASLLIGWSWIFSGARPGALRPIGLWMFRYFRKRLGIPLSPSWEVIICGTIELLSIVILSISTPISESSGSFGQSTRLSQFFEYGLFYYLSLLGFFLWIESPFHLGKGVGFKNAGFFMNTLNSSKRHLCLSFGSCSLVWVFESIKNHPIALATPLLNALTFPLQALFLMPFAVMDTLKLFWIELLCDSPGGPQVPLMFNWVYQMYHDILLYLIQGTFYQTGLILISLPFFLITLTVIVLSTFFSFKFQKEGRLIVKDRGNGIKFGLAVLCLTLSLGQHSFSRPQPELIQLNVGQGDSLLIKTETWTGLIDSGPTQGVPLTDWLRLLMAKHVNRFDGIYHTHFDSDHSAQTFGLRQLLTVNSWTDPDHPFPNLSTQASGRFFPGEIHFETLEPKGWDRENQKGNSSMIGYAVHNFSQDFIYFNLGDAPQALERKFIPWIKTTLLQTGNPQKRVLKLSHHGSNTSSSEALLSSILPTECWISYGWQNQYGHPGLDALKRVTSYRLITSRASSFIPFKKDKRCLIRPTAREGALIYRLDKVP